jgi:hypothetical protein
VGLVVTGISSSSNFAAIESALKTAGLSLDHLELIDGDNESEGRVSSIIAPADANILTGDNAMHVPGLTAPDPSRFRDETIADRLSDLEIPDTELDNYLEAIEAGRAVFAYYARPENIDKVQETFRSNGVANVRVF